MPQQTRFGGYGGGYGGGFVNILMAMLQQNVAYDSDDNDDEDSDYYPE